MTKALLPALCVACAALAAAATLAVTIEMRANPVTATITIVSGAAGLPATASTMPSPTPPPSPVCTAITASAGAVEPAPGTTRCGLPSHVTLQDRVWFGAYWQLLKTPIVLGGGYANARIDRTGDGDFFDGIVEKLDASGRVTDVVVAFAGAQGADAVQGEAVLLGIPLDEAARATQVYERIFSDPRYANARIHVTGHSLGTGYTQYVLAYALATHGAEATDARADFLGFGATNWLASAAGHFGVDPVDAAARMVDFTAANDPVLVNGVVRIGINTYLPAFTGLSGLGGAVTAVAAHYPTTYAAALGLPDWLSASDKADATAALSAQFATGNAIAPGYGPAGTLPLTVDGSGKADWLQGLAGADRLIGHGGADILTGGAGADRFVYLLRTDSGPSRETEDRITDFSQSEGDRIDVSALSALPLTFIGNGTFGAPGQVRTASEGGDTLVMINLDADPAPEMIIRLSGRVALTTNDLVLRMGG